jgi:hypothetical protein
MNFSFKKNPMLSHAALFNLKNYSIMFSFSWWFISSPPFHATENWPEIAPS